jgi:hypothetical protein
MVSCTSSGSTLKTKTFIWICGQLTGCLLFLNCAVAPAQSRKVFGYARDAATGKPLPFPHVLVDDGKQHGFGDMEGWFSFTVPKASQKITVKVYSYLEADIQLEEDEDTLRANLYFAHPFTFQTITTPPARALIRCVWKKRSQIDPRMERNFQYHSYNKLVITTNYISSLKLYLENLIALFGKGSMTGFGSDHHILLMESSSQRCFRAPFEQREVVKISKVSGINKPPALSLVSGFEALSIYEPFLRIGSRKYISPLAGRPFKRYIFFIQDSIITDSQTIYVVKFNPKSLRNKELLQGFLYVSSRPLGILGFQMWPAFDRESTFSLLQESQPLPSGRWFPSQIKTVFQRDRLGSLKIPIEASSKTYIFNHQVVDLKAEAFDEVIFDFQRDSLIKGDEFPARLRQERLSQKDKNTYAFYKEIGSLDGIDRFLNFGQKIALGRIPFGRVDVVFKRAITVNDVEGLRLGLGLQTTEKWSQKHQGGGYFAYGLGDERWKYGLNYLYNLSRISSATFIFQSDLAEPGIHSFAFNKLQYPTEQLRSIRISRFDKIYQFESGFQHQLRRNLLSRLAWNVGRREYTYSYQYFPNLEQAGIGISEFKATLHWSPGEQFARFGGERFSLGSRFPAFWFQFTQGFRPGVRDAYNFSRFETKMQWTRRILGLGELGFQVLAGWMKPDAPFPLLFAARASFKDISLLSYNSFETMRYGEFVNNQFVHVFFTHKFSKMQISNLPYRPYFTFVHNMGWGEFQKSENHKGIKLEGMPKGYYESGLFLNDLFMIPLVGVNLGIGGGVFIRYGPYALPGYLDNMALKFSTNLTL